jgi:cell wall-associated NlpC family hydrolase
VSDARRALVIAKARGWIGTPYHHEARVRGGGVDCGQLPLAVYEAAGIIPYVEMPHYPPDFAQHSDDEWYRRTVERFARDVAVPQPGDFAIWLMGRSYSHGAIVVAWPIIIHAFARMGQVVEMSVEHCAELKFIGRSGKPRPVRFYSPFAD